MIIGLGGRSDPAALALDTRKRNHIVNLLPPPERIDLLRRATNKYIADFDRAVFRSFSSQYNCMGMVFAARRCQISPDQLDLILRDDDYRPIGPDDLKCGDVVVYALDGVPVHVGTVISIERVLGNTIGVRVLSKWGECGEFEHFINDVPAQLGQPTRYFTDRMPIP